MQHSSFPFFNVLGVIYGRLNQRFVHTMRAIQGALIAASTFQIIVGFFGIWRIVIRSLHFSFSSFLFFFFNWIYWISGYLE